MKKFYSVAVLGSTGYVGLELVRILSKHPNVKINFLGSETNTNININQLDKLIKNVNLPIVDYNKNFNPKNSDFVFLCLPHGVSHNFVKSFYNKIKIIDLSADFRLDFKNDYYKNYSKEHSCTNHLKNFIYGLPELNYNKIQNSSNISVPGCYPTSILLPMVPLLRNKLISSKDIIVDSKSGYSGAGKNFNIKKINNKKDLNFYNYNTNEHRHICEIKQELQKITDKNIDLSFNPHILPVFRGMMSTIYCHLENNITLNDVKKSMDIFCKNLNFVHLLTKSEEADFFSIQNTNDCKIKIFKHSNNSKIIIVSLIDNLIKGAAGQAVQCFNIMQDLDEKISLVNIK